ncbi:hypothetical protein DL96DRAFT_1621428 [Flagelloscypha sp. PMI_526]|nr:hypothetical protein DL96DRAFT_1621428 [Flagelloscypha sp. PMI_526]
MATGNLAVELLENIIYFLDGDLSTLAACSLTSSSLLPACRAARFHSITLRKPLRAREFLALLQDRPDISLFVLSLRIIGPQDYSMDSVENSPELLLQVLSHLKRVVNLQIIGGPDYGGVWWKHIPWLQAPIGELPNLQTVVVENWMDPEVLSHAPYLEKIKGIGFFNPGSKDSDIPFRRDMLPRRPLSVLRLAWLNDDYTVTKFLSEPLGAGLDLSQLRSLALSTATVTACPTAMWLTSLLPQCSRCLQHLALEPTGSPNDLIVPEGGLPLLQSIHFVFGNDTFIAEQSNLQAWLSSLLSCAPELQRGQITMTFTGYDFVFQGFSPASVLSTVPLLSRFAEALKPFPLCRVTLCYDQQLKEGEVVVPRDSLGLPESWVYKPRYSHVTFWTCFYDL